MNIEGFKAYKLAQWDKVKDSIPGLSLSQTGKDEATFIIGFWSEALGEQRIIIGRPAFQRRAAGRDELIVDGGENVSMKEIEAIVAAWRSGKRYVKT